ncbi:hypothetical protein AAE250_14635 [Bacteroides sp. GD17]|uniref:hypothetical protein n=1 Tax=Bacteroides sp. GD17 TaxID=3139826 RepID=UPI0025CCF5A7|nr:hypothetical protein [uncultured Bacteroides sp.]
MCDAYEYIVGLVKYLNGTREGNDTRLRETDAKLDAVIKRLEIRMKTAGEPAFPVRPKRLKDVPAFVFKNVSLYCCGGRTVFYSP